MYFTLCNTMVLFIQSKTCADSIINYANDFYTMESIYNFCKTYDFGLLPYSFAQKIIDGQNINEIVKEYIDRIDNSHKHYEYKLKILCIHILAILSHTSIITDDICKDINILDIIDDTYDLFVKYPTMTISKACNILKLQYNNVQDFVVRVYMDINKITKENINAFKQCLGDYYNIAVKYTHNSIQSYKNALNTIITENINTQLNKLASHDLALPVNIEQYLLQDNLSSYDIYIYTSFMIQPHHLIVTDDNYYTILLTNVYDDIINYTIFKSLANDTTWNHWTLCKTVADELIVCCYQQHINVINTAKFITELKSRNVDQYIIDKFNINTKYIIVDSKSFCDFEKSEDLNLYLDICSDSLQVLFKQQYKYLYSQYTVNSKKIVNLINIGTNKTIYSTTITG